MIQSSIVNFLAQHAEKAAGAASHAAGPHVPTLAVWLIPLLPIFGFLFQVFVGRKMAKPIVSLVSCGVVLASAFLSWWVFLTLAAVKDPHARVIEATLGPWIQVPGLKDGWLKVAVNHRLVVDALTSVMLLVVTNIGFFIHWYSVGYMAEEKRYARYFSYLNLFTGFMLILVMGSSILLMFVGWEGVGLCSYLLIGFWYEKKENAAAGMKAFVVNRIGDFAFTIGAMTLFVYLGVTYGAWTLDFDGIKETVTAHHKELAQTAIPTAVGILLFIGATGKSAQIPLFVWLPDAMAGPTPVSALIHAATMVTAGVYMIARMSFLFALSPVAMGVVATVGALTALLAGTIGFAQNDIKKVLAYSTVSQLGFMFLGVGVGAWAAGIFHLFTHAFFKACLFLGSGSVIHGMGGEQDIRKMGGLKAKMPITFWTFVIASAALSGIFPLAGFFSKDEILWKAFTTHAFWPWLGKTLWLLGAGAAGCTAFYMTRLVIKTFLGRPQWAQASAFSGGGVGHGHDDEEDDSLQLPPLGDDASLLDMGKLGKAHDAHAPAHGDAGHGHGADDAHGGGGHGHGHGHGEPHESPFSMWLALVVLAAASCVVGFLGMPHVFHVPNFFEEWLHPSVHVGYLPESHGPAWLEWTLMAVSTGIALGGIFLGWRVYATRGGVPAQDFAEKHPEVYRLALEKYRWDEFYDRNVVEPTLTLNEAAAVFDGVVVDGAVNGAAAITKWKSRGVGIFDNEVVDGAVNLAAEATQEAGRRVRRLQTGNIREYLTIALVGALAVIAVFCLYLTLRS
jgi:NADH-quinone oxidoreductase subunit L